MIPTVRTTNSFRSRIALMTVTLTGTAVLALGQAPQATPAGAPPVVTGLKAVSGNAREVPLSWDMSPSDKVTGYEVRRTSPGAAISMVIGTVSGRKKNTFLDRAERKAVSGVEVLKDGQTYKYQVAALTKDNVSGPLGEPVEATPRNGPAMPSAPTVSTQLPHTIKLQWQANAESNVVEYAVEGADAAAGPFQPMATVKARQKELTVTDDKRPNGTKRYYRIKALDRDKLESVWSAVVEGASKPAPTAPGSLSGEWSKGKLNLTWVPVQSDITKYRVWKKTEEEWKSIAMADEPKCAVQGGKPGQKITLAVTAIDKDGLESPKSQDVTF